jgi:CDP-paratose 2-epimerase
MKPPVLITGGAGFIGSALADQLAAGGEQVLVLDSLARPGTEANLEWLRARHPARVASVIADVRRYARPARCSTWLRRSPSPPA